jgi:hypothetical protein
MRELLVPIFLAVAAATGGAAEPRPRDWLRSPADTVVFQQSARQVGETSFLEVRITRLMTAVDELKEKSAIPLTEELARCYTGPLYKSEGGKKAYLVRGLFANETGNHRLFWRNGSLLIRHDSLGHSFDPQFSPLVVNLSAEPK